MCDIPAQDGRNCQNHMEKMLALSGLDQRRRDAIRAFLEQNCENPSLRSDTCPYRTKVFCERFPCDLVNARNKGLFGMKPDSSDLWNLAFHTCIDPSSSKCQPLLKETLKDPKDEEIIGILAAGTRGRINKDYTAKVLETITTHAQDQDTD